MAYTLALSYIGEDDHSWGDVIGDVRYFQISEAELSLSGTILTVDIHTNFAGLSGSLFTSITGENGIGYGDLFLNNNWVTEDLDNGIDNTWSYVFSLGDARWDNPTVGTGNLYQVSDTNLIQNSEDFLTGGTYRDGQEVAYNAPGDVDAFTAGNWYVLDDYISFVMDIAGTDLLNGNSIGIHWGMTCANDVIQGSAPVPEPATMLLLGTGLIGLAGIGRKKLFKK
jgi:hypothetical protein